MATRSTPSVLGHATCPAPSSRASDPFSPRARTLSFRGNTESRSSFYWRDVAASSQTTRRRVSTTVSRQSTFQRHLAYRPNAAFAASPGTTAPHVRILLRTFAVRHANYLGTTRSRAPMALLRPIHALPTTRHGAVSSMAPHAALSATLTSLSVPLISLCGAPTQPFPFAGRRSSTSCHSLLATCSRASTGRGPGIPSIQRVPYFRPRIPTTGRPLPLRPVTPSLPSRRGRLATARICSFTR